jgi:hypothetical protein
VSDPKTAVSLSEKTKVLQLYEPFSTTLKEVPKKLSAKSL